MTTAKELMDVLVLMLDQRIRETIKHSTDPLDQAKVIRLNPENLPPDQRKVWDGTNATSLILQLLEGEDFQIHIIRVPPHIRRIREQSDGQ